MKKIIIALVLVQCALAGKSQITEGRIIYERKMNMHKQIPPQDEQMKAMVPEFSTSKVELLFSGDELVFRNLPEEEDVRDQAGDDGNRIVMRMSAPSVETYKNLTTGKMVESRELGPKKYIIEDSIRSYKWTVTGENKLIGKYNCTRATAVSTEKREIIAWFTTEIPVSGGPEAFGGLPGMILELNFDQNGIIYSLMEVTEQLNQSLVKAPSGGKKISRAEFTKLIQESFGGPGNGQPVIRIIRD